MKRKEPMTLAEMAARAAGSTGIACPKCGCRDFRTYGGKNGESTRFHYKACRHCGHRILTASKTTERIVRDVSPRGGDELDDLLMGDADEC
jgi:DNA-directed RNA polymerase subunit RPC12/RpoP